MSEYISKNDGLDGPKARRVKAKCPTCGIHHIVISTWTGRGTYYKFCSKHNPSRDHYDHGRKR